MLAYVFWHRPRERGSTAAYERAEVAFQRSLTRRPPAGFSGCASFRIPRLPWTSKDAAGEAYEDWYLLEDYAALGVLNEAAIARGHRSAHDAVAGRSGWGSGGLYRLLEGDRGRLAVSVSQATLAVWVSGPPGAHGGVVAELLGDGMERGQGTLWRRELVLGRADEFCVLGRAAPSGVAITRLPAGWKATALERRALAPG